MSAEEEILAACVAALCLYAHKGVRIFCLFYEMAIQGRQPRCLPKCALWLKTVLSLWHSFAFQRKWNQECAHPVGFVVADGLLLGYDRSQADHLVGTFSRFLFLPYSLLVCVYIYVRLCLWEFGGFYGTPLFSPSPSPLLLYYISCRRDQQHEVGISRCRTNTFHNSFIPKTCSEWNRPLSCIAMPQNS